MLEPAPKPGDIYELIVPKLRRSKHRHPVLFIRVSAAMATFVFLSSEFSLYTTKKDFAIRIKNADSEDFKKTGLSKSSYLIDAEVYFDVLLSQFEGIYLGKIGGELKARIEDLVGRTHQMTMSRPRHYTSLRTLRQLTPLPAASSRLAFLKAFGNPRIISNSVVALSVEPEPNRMSGAIIVASPLKLIDHILDATKRRRALSEQLSGNIEQPAVAADKPRLSIHHSV
jgi:hypothetical protein